MSYAALAGLFLLPVLLVTVLAAVRRRPGPRWWLTTGATVAALLALTIVFDSLMIAADLFRYAEEDLLGVRLLLTPLEDLAWPLAAGLLLPALRVALAPRPTDASPAPTDRQLQEHA